MTVSGAGQISAAQPTGPAPPPDAVTIATRMVDAEERGLNHNERIAFLEQCCSCLVAQVIELRAQMGMSPLEPNHFQP